MWIFYMTSRKNYKKRSLKKGGNCNCQHPSIFNGGGALGPASLGNLVVDQHAYPVNTHQTDPNAPVLLVASRMEPNLFPAWNPISGGKRKNRKSARKINKRKLKKTLKRRYRKIKGGDLYGNAIIQNPTFSAGTVAGVPIAANIIAGKTNAILNPPQTVIETPFI